MPPVTSPPSGCPEVKLVGTCFLPKRKHLPSATEKDYFIFGTIRRNKLEKRSKDAIVIHVGCPLTFMIAD